MLGFMDGLMDGSWQRPRDPAQDSTLRGIWLVAVGLRSVVHKFRWKFLLRNNTCVIFPGYWGQSARFDANFSLLSTAYWWPCYLGIEPNHKVLRPKVSNHDPPTIALDFTMYCLPITIITANVLFKPHFETNLFLPRRGLKEASKLTSPGCLG